MKTGWLRIYSFDTSRIDWARLAIPPDQWSCLERWLSIRHRMDNSVPEEITPRQGQRVYWPNDLYLDQLMRLIGKLGPGSNQESSQAAEFCLSLLHQMNTHYHGALLETVRFKELPNLENWLIEADRLLKKFDKDRWHHLLHVIELGPASEAIFQLRSMYLKIPKGKRFLELPSGKLKQNEKKKLAKTIINAIHDRAIAVGSERKKISTFRPVALDFFRLYEANLTPEAFRKWLS